MSPPHSSVLICAVILISTARLLLDSLNVLLEGAPAHLDTEEIRRCLVSTPGVDEVHELHVWSLAGGTPMLTAHLVVDHSVTAIEVLRQAGRTLRERFGVTHATLQVEPPDYNIVDGLTPAASVGRNDGEDRG